ncbi:hypothetical protein NLG97_g871 [Lecanicillium saksenae]|uniref:Uncharacterized protein n=1 Tax=Lecanicillium saksenae TaxID=468837 RepID=A0ACC1R5A9_9HYPO|nr:hypothetical protein NLG97_g871 [Lecanicillium saksenae]
MSPSNSIPHIITYCAPSHAGSLFIAGTFSKPEWLLQEMHCTEPSASPHTYSIRVMVEPGKEYQYRFRQGREGDWAVDEQKPIVKSALGTKSNILRAKQPEKPSSGYDTVSLTVPLFAHERLGAYTLSDGNDANDSTAPLKREISPRTLSDAPVDLNDPTLESFPCDKSSILGTLRKIQSSLGEQPVAVECSRSGRRGSLDSDDGSSGSASPGSYRRRENRLSNGSKRNLSLASLGSIAEEPSSGGQRRELRNIAEAPLVDTGDGLMMRSSKRQ